MHHRATRSARSIRSARPARPARSAVAGALLTAVLGATIAAAPAVGAQSSLPQRDITYGGRGSSVPTGSRLPEGVAIGSIGGNELTQVDHLDPKKYVGKWYQVAAIPQPFSLQCGSNTTAYYDLIDAHTISVKNSCTTWLNNTSSINGKARIKDAQTNASLTVAFDGVPAQNLEGPVNYRVTYLASDYSLAIVGDPQRISGFVLSRTPSLTPDQWKLVKSSVTNRGYWDCAFFTTPQAGGRADTLPLCLAVR